MDGIDQELSKLAKRVGASLQKQGRYVATAESCTGGWIAKTITDIAGSSAWFKEGFVTYSNASKEIRLGVPRRILQRVGSVSQETAEAMARGALRVSAAQVAVAVTGIAGPSGAVPGKPVGTVWLAWAERVRGRVTMRSQRRRFRGDRDAIRRATVRAALNGLLKG